MGGAGHFGGRQDRPARRLHSPNRASRRSRTARTASVAVKMYRDERLPKTRASLNLLRDQATVSAEALVAIEDEAMAMAYRDMVTPRATYSLSVAPRDEGPGLKTQGLPDMTEWLKIAVGLALIVWLVLWSPW